MDDNKISYRNRIQEYCAKNKITFPEYIIKNVSDDFINKYTCVAKFNNEIYKLNRAYFSKKNAIQATAHIIFNKLCSKTYI